jgi:hypothetical protein
MPRLRFELSTLRLRVYFDYRYSIQHGVNKWPPHILSPSIRWKLVWASRPGRFTWREWALVLLGKKLYWPQSWSGDFEGEKISALAVSRTQFQISPSPYRSHYIDPVIPDLFILIVSLFLCMSFTATSFAFLLDPSFALRIPFRT